MNIKAKIYVALPVMGEMERLPSCLQCIERQEYPDYHVVICVNQPDEWWIMPEMKTICENNRETLSWLSTLNKNIYTIIDKSSKGKGWIGNKKGVGWARKTTMDHISMIAQNNDIIVSLDADTVFGKHYFSSIVQCFVGDTNSVALANPYYHSLTGAEAKDRAILRYEIYMRNYAINMMLINSPYSFTALGSAITLPVASYRAIGGLTPKLSGEDFYFLQKLRKYGNIIVHNSEKVYPATRFSDRVFFGTGQAMIKGKKGDWESYPVYHHSLFNHIKETYNCFPALFTGDVATTLTTFLQQQFSEKNLWQPLRKNNKDEEHFIRACHEKLDGLRILQYLKSEQQSLQLNDEICLWHNITGVFCKINTFEKVDHLKELDFNHCSVAFLDDTRNYLVETEAQLQQKLKQV